MDSLKIFNLVLRDINLKSIPARNSNGTFIWNSGLLEIIHQSQYLDIKTNLFEIERLRSVKKLQIQDMINSENPTILLENEGKTTKQSNDNLIENAKQDIQLKKAELDDFEQDLMNRGVSIEVKKEKETALETSPEKKEYNRWKYIFSFVLTWIVGEVFMTYVQWQSLRDTKGIEDLFVRSLSFAVVLFLTHYIGHLFQKKRLLLHKIYLITNFGILLIMLFAPLIVNVLYPVNADNINISSQWSIVDEGTVNQSLPIECPMWVIFYRKFEFLPGVISFLLYLAITFFAPKQNKDGICNSQKTDEFKPQVKIETEEEKLRKRREFFMSRLHQAQNECNALEGKKQKELSPNTKILKSILDKLQSQKEKVENIDSKIFELSTLIDTKIIDLNKDFIDYQTQYNDILRKETVFIDRSILTWPTKSDIFDYYK